MIYTAGYVMDLDGMIFNRALHCKQVALISQILKAVKDFARARLPFANCDLPRIIELERVRHSRMEELCNLSERVLHEFPLASSGVRRVRTSERRSVL